MVADDTARHAVDRAPTDRAQQQGLSFRRETSAGRTVRKIERPKEFLDLVGACHHFAAQRPLAYTGHGAVSHQGHVQ